MIEGIDIFEPRDSGLPNLAGLSPVQIFNGSAAASFNAMKEQHDPDPKPEGAVESPWKTTTIDPSTGKRVEVRKATVVNELLDGGSAVARGHRKTGGSNDYSAPGLPETPDLPETPETPVSPSLIDGTTPSWHPPMSKDYGPQLESPQSESPILPNPDILLGPKDTARQKLRPMLLEELKNLHMLA